MESNYALSFPALTKIPAKAIWEQGDEAKMPSTEKKRQCHSYSSIYAKLPCSPDKTATPAISENLFTPEMGYCGCYLYSGFVFIQQFLGAPGSTCWNFTFSWVVAISLKIFKSFSLGSDSIDERNCWVDIEQYCRAKLKWPVITAVFIINKHKSVICWTTWNIT